MVKKVFKGENLAQCLTIASKEVNIPDNEINYKIIKEKNGLLKKECIIEVHIEEKKNIGTIAIKEGKVIVTNGEEGQKAAILSPCTKGTIKVNGVILEEPCEVFENSIIEYCPVVENGGRNINIVITKDAMEAYISVEYKKPSISILMDSEPQNKVIPQEEYKSNGELNKFSIDDIKENLKKMGVINGIIDENLSEASNGCIDLIIAKGEAPIDDKEDFIDVKFKEHDIRALVEEGKQIDYKDTGVIHQVIPGDVIGERIIGEIGKDGIDVKGQIKKKKDKKQFIIKCGVGTKLENNKVYATMKGKPKFRNGIFEVTIIHEVANDINLKTGNVVYNGDIVIRGTIEEGMKVKCGGDLTIYKGVNIAELNAKGNVDIKGNIIGSNITGGGQDADKVQCLADLQELRTLYNNLTICAKELKSNNMFHDKSSDGQIIKVLLESKFKKIVKVALRLLSSPYTSEAVTNFIRSRIIGLGPLNIKYMSEVYDFMDRLKEDIECTKEGLSLPVNVNISYCQDTTIKSSGNIYVIGKGQYISNLFANDGIYFQGLNAVARGGEMKAKNIIKCKTVGSTAGVVTKLVVEERGHIWADIAYINTKIVVGLKEYLIDSPCRNLHAFLDEGGELTVEKLKL